MCSRRRLPPDRDPVEVFFENHPGLRDDGRGNIEFGHIAASAVVRLDLRDEIARAFKERKRRLESVEKKAAVEKKAWQPEVDPFAYNPDDPNKDDEGNAIRPDGYRIDPDGYILTPDGRHYLKGVPPEEEDDTEDPRLCYLEPDMRPQVESAEVRDRAADLGRIVAAELATNPDLIMLDSYDDELVARITALGPAPEGEDAHLASALAHESVRIAHIRVEFATSINMLAPKEHLVDDKASFTLEAFLSRLEAEPGWRDRVALPPPPRPM